MSLHHIRPTEIAHLNEAAENESRHRALVKTSQFEAMRLLLAAGEEIREHQVAGFATVHCLHGSVVLVLVDRSVTMTSGDWLYLDRGQRHSLRANKDAGVLVTIMLDK